MGRAAKKNQSAKVKDAAADATAGIITHPPAWFQNADTFLLAAAGGEEMQAAINAKIAQLSVKEELTAEESRDLGSIAVCALSFVTQHVYLQQDRQSNKKRKLISWLNLTPPWKTRSSS